MLGTIIGLIIVGLIAGYLARAIVPGRQKMTIGQTLLLGIIGSFVGGFLGRLLLGHGDSLIQPSSWLGSIIGSILVLFGYLQLQRHRT